MPANETIILGLDPGLQVTGYGVIGVGPNATRLIEGGTIGGGSSERPLGERLCSLHAGLAAVIADHHPDAAAMEQLYSHYAHPRTAILMGHARGVLTLAAAQAGILTVDYAATEVKSSLTGSGRASKEQMQRAVRGALNLSAVPEPADVADALAVALCHAHRMREHRG